MSTSSSRWWARGWRQGTWRNSSLLVMLLLVSCSSGPAAEPASAPAARGAASAAAPAEPPRARRPVKISFATDSAVSAPLWIAEDAGLFEKYGIDAEVTYIRGGATNTQAIIAGSVDMSFSGSVATVTANLAGADMRFIATTAVVANQAIVTQPAVTRPEQLRGKAIALGVAGGSSVPQLAQALQRVGLGITDLRLLDIPIQGDRLAALVNGSVEAIMVPQAVTEEAARQGYHVLLDLAREGIPNQGQSMVALQGYLEQHPAIVKDVLRAFCEGVYVQLTDRALAEQAIAKWAKIDDPVRLESMYRAASDQSQRKPYPSLAGIQSLLDGLAEQYPEARGARPERFVNDTALRELDAEGFFDTLWK